jgi:glycosyltransferase involved in cell wall biosynthesis
MDQKTSKLLLTNCISEFHDKNLVHFEAVGKEHLKDKKVILVGIVRDVSEQLDKFQDVVRVLRVQVPDIEVFLYENDSTDNTVELLQRWSEENDWFHFKSEKRDAPDLRLSTSDDRTINLSYARNECLDWVREYHPNSDYVIVIDPDMRDYYIPGLVNGVGHMVEKNIDAMAGCAYLYKNIGDWNGKALTDEPQFTGYDCWAYRHTDWFDGHRNGLMFWFYYYILPVGSNPHKVLSAFGGSCIYKTKSYLLGIYTGGDCEHVNFHKSISEEDKEFNLYVNPSQVFIV